MADKKTRYENSVRITGYLKENNLEKVTDARGHQIIRGSLVIATSKSDAHRIQYYVSETNFQGTENKNFPDMEAMLGANVISIADYLRHNNGATYEDAMNAATKVRAIGYFDEYASRVGERMDSSVTVKGWGCTIIESDKEFTPHSKFEVRMYLSKKEPEMENEVKTGRLLLEGYLPKADKYNSVDVVDFVAVENHNGDPVASVIDANWQVGDTVRIEGYLVNILEKTPVSDAVPADTFGSASSAVKYDTKFIRERRVCGGDKTPKHAGEEGAITPEMVKAGLAGREIKMDDNGARSRARKAGGSNSGDGFGTSAAPAAPKPVTPTNPVDDAMDF